VNSPRDVAFSLKFEGDCHTFLIGWEERNEGRTSTMADERRSSKEKQVTAKRAACFAEGDYAGLLRRLIIVCVDLATIILIWFVLLAGIWLLWFIVYPEREHPPAAVLWFLPLTAYLYLTVVKRSRIGSLGFLLTGVRIVNTEGKRPSLLEMTARFFWLLPLPLGVLLDLGWLMEEPAKQTLRDKWAGTFVVKRKAKPIGSAPLGFKRIHLLGIQMVVPELDRTAMALDQSESAQPFDAGDGHQG
jgi:uncharacterized RDD family membrane protein YckC